MIQEWKNIPDNVRPKVRYWVPGAAVDDADLIMELKALHARGFGGVEVVGLLCTPDEIIGSPDGWGGESWNHMLQVIDQTCVELGMTMDVANGPMWPISMPTVTDADDPAALTELTYGVLDLDAGAAGQNAGPDAGEADAAAAEQKAVPDAGAAGQNAGPDAGAAGHNAALNAGAEVHYTGRLPERRVKHAEGTVTLAAAMAYAYTGDGVLVLDSYVDLLPYIAEAGPDGLAQADVTLPQAPSGGGWKIYAFYEQPAVQKTGNDRYYVIDHLSRAGADACRAYWEPQLKNIPLESMESIFCDSLEYAVSMDWTKGFAGLFEERCGYSLLPYLPFIGEKGTYPESDVPGAQCDHPDLADMVNQDYLEMLTQCYCENHLTVLEEMAEKFGKTIRYQVAYNKPFDMERCGLYVGVPENEALGRPAMDGLKSMAAAAQLGRKERYSFECAAEFGNCYGQDAEDLFWWVKRSLMSGMNAQVLHGASYSGGYSGEYSEDGFMKGCAWPGYEAFFRIVSNNWNRTISAEDQRGVLDAVSRLNAVFRKTAKVDCLVYRSSYLNDGCASEFSYFDDGGKLSNAGYSYETISPFLLQHPNCTVQDGVLDAQGAAWQCLLIPPQEAVPKTLLNKVSALLDAGFPVIWFGEKPKRAQYRSEWRTEEQRAAWAAAMDSVWAHPGLTHGADVQEAANLLAKAGIRPRLGLDGSMDLTTAVHEDEEAGMRYYAVYGYNRVEFDPQAPADHEEIAVSAIYRKGTTKSTYKRPGKGSRHTVQVSLDAVGAVSILDPWSGKAYAAEFSKKGGRMEGKLSIEEDEMILLAVDTNRACEEDMADSVKKTDAGDKNCAYAEGAADSAAKTDAGDKKRTCAEGMADNTEKAAGCGRKRLTDEVTEIPVYYESLTLRAFGPDTPDEKSFLRSSLNGPEIRIPLGGIPAWGMKPWHAYAKVPETFAGEGVYRANVTLLHLPEEGSCILCLGDVCDTFRVWVNGIEAPFPDQVMKQADITGLLHEGTNTLEIRVTSNLYNLLLKDHAVPGMPMVIPYNHKDYGIVERSGKRCMLRVSR